MPNASSIDPSDSLPDVWVRAHPFSEPDAHGERFSARTDFYDEFLPHVPVNYYHSHTPDGKWADKPLIVGTSVDRKYQADGRWDKLHFFEKEKIPQDIYQRLLGSLNDGTFRSSPTVVPDIHVVSKDGHIDHWATGSIAVFDATDNRRPANWNAIGIAEMKALYEEANLEFPNLQRVELGKEQSMKTEEWKQKARAAFNDFMKAVGLSDAAPTTDDEPDEETDEMKAQWDEYFHEDEPAAETDISLKEEKVMSEEKTTDKAVADLRLEYDNRMKAMLEQNADLARRVDRADIEKWIDTEVNRDGVRVLPAEREGVIAMALQLKADDAAPSTMKADDGKVTTRLDAFKATVMARSPKLPLDGKNEMKFAGFGDSNQKDATKPTPARVEELLEKTADGRAALKDMKANGNGK